MHRVTAVVIAHSNFWAQLSILLNRPMPRTRPSNREMEMAGQHVGVCTPPRPCVCVQSSLRSSPIGCPEPPPASAPPRSIFPRVRPRICQSCPQLNMRSPNAGTSHQTYCTPLILLASPAYHSVCAFRPDPPKWTSPRSWLRMEESGPILLGGDMR